jgi:hypothetical protein
MNINTTTTAASPWLGNPPTIESIKQLSDTFRFNNMESLRTLAGMRFIVDKTGELTAANEYVLVLGHELHAKLQQHIKENPIPSAARKLLDGTYGN